LILNKEKKCSKTRLVFKKWEAMMELMRSKPRESWVMARNLEAGHNSHHQTNQVLHFSKDGVKAMGDKGENLLDITCTNTSKMSTIENHFLLSLLSTRYSRDLISLILTNYHPSKNSYDAIASMAMLAAPGKSGLPPLHGRNYPGKPD
jgi:hypothetical protein